MGMQKNFAPCFWLPFLVFYRLTWHYCLSNCCIALACFESVTCGLSEQITVLPGIQLLIELAGT